MENQKTTCDGSKRARRNGAKGVARQLYYARYRTERFNRRFGLN